MPYLKVEDVCRMFGKDKTTIYKWIKNKGMPTIKMPGGSRRFIKEDIEKWAFRNTTTTNMLPQIEEIIRIAELLKKMYSKDREAVNENKKD